MDIESLASPAVAETKFVIDGPRGEQGLELKQRSVGREIEIWRTWMIPHGLPLQVAGGEGLLPAVHAPRDRRYLICSAF